MPYKVASDQISVLLVEDDAAHARLTQVLLAEGGGFGVVDVADTLAAALARIAVRAYDAVLLDLGLPDARGLQALSGVLAVVPEVPVLVLTSSDDDHQATEAVRLGAQDFLIKGRIDATHLRRAIAYGIERKRLLRAGLAEGMLEGILNNSRNTIMTLIPEIADDGRCWRVALANPACELTFGHPLREIEGARLDAVVAPETAREIGAVLDGRRFHGAVRRGLRVGSASWMAVGPAHVRALAFSLSGAPHASAGDRP